LSINTYQSFTPFELAHDQLADLSDDKFPSVLAGWNNKLLKLENIGTHFGYVQSGQAIINCSAGMFTLQSGMYFSLPGQGSILGEGKGIVITRLRYQGMFNFGGPIEKTGRLRYIDGCTDTLLIPPVFLGDPCLNVLYFPPGICQTPHTHPSIRVGIVTSGQGECITPSGNIQLLPDQVFLIHTDGLHSFRTMNSPMVVIAYHPDSDFGPTHEIHPMLNRTIIDRVST
jgi:AraC-like ligand binding domain